jgi:uncharacterized metal-binding protein
METETEKVLVFACSGVGKVHGLMSREAAYLVADELAPADTDVACLALLVKGDEETVAAVQARPCITIDGCGKACAKTNVEIAGGEVAQALQVGRFLTAHRGAQPGNGSELTDEGWSIAREIAEAAAEEASRLRGATRTAEAGGGGLLLADEQVA